MQTPCVSSLDQRAATWPAPLAAFVRRVRVFFFKRGQHMRSGWKLAVGGSPTPVGAKGCLHHVAGSVARMTRRPFVWLHFRRLRKHLAEAKRRGSTQAIGRYYRTAKRNMTEQLRREVYGAGFQ